MPDVYISYYNASCQFVAIYSILFYFRIVYKGVSILCRNRTREMFLTKYFQVQTAVSEHLTLKSLRRKAQCNTIKPSKRKQFNDISSAKQLEFLDKVNRVSFLEKNILWNFFYINWSIKSIDWFERTNACFSVIL